MSLEDESTGEAGGGELDSNGIATIEKVVTGNYVVTVVPLNPDPGPTRLGFTKKVKKQQNMPMKFRSIRTSSLSAQVKEGSNEFEFDLKEAK